MYNLCYIKNFKVLDHQTRDFFLMFFLARIPEIFSLAPLAAPLRVARPPAEHPPGGVNLI